MRVAFVEGLSDLKEASDEDTAKDPDERDVVNGSEQGEHPPSFPWSTIVLTSSKLLHTTPGFIGQSNCELRLVQPDSIAKIPIRTLTRNRLLIIFFTSVIKIRVGYPSPLIAQSVAMLTAVVPALVHYLPCLLRWPILLLDFQNVGLSIPRYLGKRHRNLIFKLL
jgi:hypothetical protein